MNAIVIVLLPNSISVKHANAKLETNSTLNSAGLVFV